MTDWKIDCLDHGFVRLIDTMGDDDAIVQAARVSYGKGTKSSSDDRGLIRYLLRHSHTTPFEMCEIKLHVKLPIFVARQWIRHRTANVNELSGRYSVVPNDFYTPKPVDVQKQSKANKQGRSGEFDAIERANVISAMHEQNDTAFSTYHEFLYHDVSRELARTILPLSTYTEFYWKIDLHNLLHFLKLRTDAHAQYEIRVFADAIAEMVADWCPVAYEAWVDYRRDAVPFSRIEMELLRGAVNLERLEYTLETEAGLSKREKIEFLAKLGLPD